jgi:hypothetical protein
LAAVDGTALGLDELPADEAQPAPGRAEDAAEVWGSGQRCI